MEDGCLFNTLPIELMCEIFSCVTLLDGLSLSTYPFHVPASHRAPLLLTKVCSQWRNVVLNTPTLWSSLAIDMERILDSEHKRSFYRFWLDRAWGAPISLYIFDVRRSDAPLLKNHNDWVDFLLDNVPNLKYLLTGPHVFNALLQALTFKPNHRNSRALIGGRLEGFSCVFNPIDKLHEPFHDKTSAIFPNLRQVDIASSTYAGFADLQTHNLTHLSANFGLLEFLQSTAPTRTVVAFPKLVELYLSPVVRQSHVRAYELDESHRFVFPELKFLKIFDSTEGLPDTRRALPHFECPKLDTLHIENLNPLMKLTRVDSFYRSTGDFEFIAKFLETTDIPNAKRGIKYFVTRHRDFLDAAFLGHPTVRSHIQFLQIVVAFPPQGDRSISMGSWIGNTYFPPPRDDVDSTHESRRRAFAESWKSCGADAAAAASPTTTQADVGVVFSLSKPPPTMPANAGSQRAYIGWSRIPGRTIGQSFIKEWPTAFWDKDLYVGYVEQGKGPRLVAY